MEGPHVCDCQYEIMGSNPIVRPMISKPRIQAISGKLTNVGPKGYCSEWSLLRRVIVPKGHCSEGLIVPKGHRDEGHF